MLGKIHGLSASIPRQCRGRRLLRGRDLLDAGTAGPRGVDGDRLHGRLDGGVGGLVGGQRVHAQAGQAGVHGVVVGVQAVGLLEVVARLLPLAERIQQVEADFLADVEIPLVDVGRVAVRGDGRIGIAAKAVDLGDQEPVVGRLGLAGGLLKLV